MRTLSAATGCLRRRSFSSLLRPATWPEEVLAYPPKVLSQEQREEYFTHGTLVLESFVSPEWLEKLNGVMDSFIERSRSFDFHKGPQGHLPTEKDPLLRFFVFEPGHTKEKPRLTRLTSPHDLDDVFWAFTNGPAADVAEDLLGPDIKFHHSKLNFKWARENVGGEDVAGAEVRWHQDIQFWVGLLCILYPHLFLTACPIC